MIMRRFDRFAFLDSKRAVEISVRHQRTRLISSCPLHGNNSSIRLPGRYCYPPAYDREASTSERFTTSRHERTTWDLLNLVGQRGKYVIELDEVQELALISAHLVKVLANIFNIYKH